MAPTDERRRMLEELKLKRAAKSAAAASTPAPPGSHSAPIEVLDSPDPSSSYILVPSSSPPSSSVASSMSKLPQGPNIRKPPSAGSSFIPSSNLGRGAGAYGGSPQSIYDALNGRSGVKTNGSAANGNGTARAPINLADYSPQSPPALSRLKKRYPDPDSPTKPSGAGASPGPSRVGGGGPKMIALAKATHNEAMEKKISRMQTQFPKLPRPTITQALNRHGDDTQAALNELSRANEMLQSESSSSNIRNNLNQYAFQPNVPPSSSLSSSASSSKLSPAIPSPPAKAAKPLKRSKNEKSTIYKNRDKGRRRDPDEASDSDDVSDDESDGGWSDGEGRKRKRRKGSDDNEIDAAGAALRAFNEDEQAMLLGTIACSEEQAAKIVQLRPFESVDDVRAKLSKTRGVSFKLFEQYEEIMEGYVQIDTCLNRCEAIADDIANTLAVWKGASTVSDSVTGTPRSDGLNDVKVDVDKVSEMLRNETDMRRRKILSSYIRTQPALLSEGTVLKDYQLLGVNWLNLLYSRKIGCILADEMGLGKTIQVISFIAHLKERGIKGPHMVFVPASTLENWTREFERFAPSVDVQTYYGSQAERRELRDTLKRMYRQDKLEVVLASYTQVASAEDLAFFKRKLEFETCVYDEAHALKNFQTKRYQDLLSIKPRWRLLLTGTPLQNNLQELVSLLMFIHKDIFTEAEPYLRAIFKVQSQGHQNLLSQQRVSRARTMLTPFVLRRRKANVLTLPPKIETVQTCAMTPTQSRLYRETLRRSRKVMAEMGEAALEAVAEDDEDGPKKPAKGKKAVVTSSSANILMDLRKAASHPLLFRRLYNTAKVQTIAKACLNTPKWCDSRLDYVIEDLEIMSDAEIHAFVSEHEELEHFALEPETFLEGGKMRALKAHIERCKKEGKRMLLFSQFTMILNIIEVALDHLDVRYVRLDGQTRTDERQGLVDEFNEDPDITVFLLSTKAGGVGINLTAASVVVIFDQDFNPHNDRQAADRAYRIGQERSVEVIKLISKDSIDEDILSIGVTKLQLDDMVGGTDTPESGSIVEGGAADDEKTAKEMKKSLLTTLRKKFEAEGDAAKDDDDEAAKAEDDTPLPSSQGVKRAQGVKRE